MIALVVFTLIVFFTARAIGGRSFEKVQNSPQAVLERIRPFGQVRVGKPGDVVAAAAPAAAPAQATAPAAEAAEPAAAAGATGEAVYSKACIGCHSTGVLDSPKVGDKAAWEPRLAQGLDALMSSALKGKGAMPPKGGYSSLSDAEVKSAIQYMLEKTGLQD
ncbi:MAG: c-type cytochrome [Gammaproteobacteria bacterium]|nr:MAG: c-type cytochrome [Gammaproteobacteria bacterium]